MRKYFISALLCFLIILTAHSPAQAEDLTKLDGGSWRPSNNIIGIHIGPAVEEIADNTFINQIQLKVIEVDEANPHFSAYSNCLYDKDQKTLLCVPQALLVVEVPPTVTSINWYALHGVYGPLANDIVEAVRKNAETLGEPFVYVRNWPEYETWPYTNDFPLTG
ncbi:MAG: hypothetical protein K5989_08315 [Lachnospiraceae bacterium]|nr:hypothetical protein [Lachnospiraceae bacterium]